VADSRRLAKMRQSATAWTWMIMAINIVAKAKPRNPVSRTIRTTLLGACLADPHQQGLVTRVAGQVSSASHLSRLQNHKQRPQSLRYPKSSMLLQKGESLQNDLPSTGIHQCLRPSSQHRRDLEPIRGFHWMGRGWHPECAK
jgi:hypothetical protein